MKTAPPESLSLRRIRIQARTTADYREHSPAAWDLRGAVGAAMHGSDFYRRLFDPPMPEREPPRPLRGSSTPPAPLLLRGPFPTACRKGAALSLHALTFLTADEDVAEIVRAMRAAAELGLGHPRVRLEPEEVSVEEPRSVDGLIDRAWSSRFEGAEAADVHVHLRSPLHMKRGGAALTPNPQTLVEGILARWRLLAWAWGADEPVPEEALPPAEALTHSGEFGAQVHRWTGSRWSERQQKRHPLSGHVGELRLRAPAPLGRVLLAGELLGIGKWTQAGFGDIRIEPAPATGS